MKRLIIPVLILSTSVFGTTIHNDEEIDECGTGKALTEFAKGIKKARPTLSGPELLKYRTNFIIHYTTSGSDSTTAAWAESVATYAQHCWNEIVTSLAWAPPPPDAGIGGDDRYDIYIRSNTAIGAHGVCVPENSYTNPYPDGSSSWVEVRRDSVTQPFPKWTRLRALVCHEFNHGCQMRYSVEELPMWWFYENTSVWMEDVVYDDVNTLPYRLRNTQYDPNPLKDPKLPITTVTGGYEYPGALWTTFLHEYYGIETVRRIWELCGSHPGNYILKDIDSVLTLYYNSNFHAALGHYGIWRYFTGTNADAYHFEEASSYDSLNIHATHSTYPANGNQGTDNPSGPGGTNFIKFTNAGNNIVHTSFNGQNGYDWAAYVVGVTPSAFTYEYKILLDANSDGSIDVPFWDYNSVVLIPIVVQWDAAADNLTYSYTTTLGTGVEQTEKICSHINLYQNSPNPFTKNTVIRFHLPVAAGVIHDKIPVASGVIHDKCGRQAPTLQIYDLTGRIVKTFTISNYATNIIWDGRADNGEKVEAGIYFYKLSVGNFTTQKKLIYLH